MFCHKAGLTRNPRTGTGKVHASNEHKPRQGARKNTFPEPCQLDFTLHSTFLASHFPRPSPPHFHILRATFHSTVQSTLHFSLDSTPTAETTPVSTPLLFALCVSSHSTLHSISISLSTSFHRASPHTFPFHSTPFRNGANSVVPAFSTNVQEPGQARGWQVSLSHHAMKTRPGMSMANQRRPCLRQWACLTRVEDTRLQKWRQIRGWRPQGVSCLSLFTRNKDEAEHVTKIPRWLAQGVVSL